MAVANTTAFCDRVEITATKSCIEQAPGQIKFIVVPKSFVVLIFNKQVCGHS